MKIGERHAKPRAAVAGQLFGREQDEFGDTGQQQRRRHGDADEDQGEALVAHPNHREADKGQNASRQKEEHRRIRPALRRRQQGSKHTGR